MYRPLRGCSYTEEELRRWVNNTWGIPPKSSIPTMAKAASNGGWVIARIIEEEK